MEQTFVSDFLTDYYNMSNKAHSPAVALQLITPSLASSLLYTSHTELLRGVSLNLNTLM